MQLVLLVWLYFSRKKLAGSEKEVISKFFRTGDSSSDSYSMQLAIFNIEEPPNNWP